MGLEIFLAPGPGKLGPLLLGDSVGLSSDLSSLRQLTQIPLGKWDGPPPRFAPSTPTTQNAHPQKDSGKARLRWSHQKHLKTSRLPQPLSQLRSADMAFAACNVGPLERSCVAVPDCIPRATKTEPVHERGHGGQSSEGWMLWFNTSEMLPHGPRVLLPFWSRG